ncbi:Vitamin B12 transporter BtuB [Usitatibacter rugosus]|uniref:Vitamin B12 transporter BtuB n=1 Tax=Usitatibacter rugosus TaxID=2732067 RepID=A0A6M4GYT1_9PROT|nr:TonB-dependent receptor [Usitatibacter rugosus]QJR10677.1 Vitamin B12 transporter BtuB [Usitatibacter rugosus]
MAMAVAMTPAFAAVPSTDRLADLSLEQLADLEITSVSKRPERLQDAPASIYVITAEDIRRSGVTRLPEALRLAPNLQVAQVTTNQWAISARGFNNAIGNKLLVLVDGRTVYTPLFSGVFWDAQDVALEDVERIEVISGPGATLWGANAVNGVINVITRSAGDTQGAAVTLAGGSRITAGEARFGARFDNGLAYRVYALGYDEDATEHQDGTSSNDEWRKAQVGFRADWGDPSSRFTLQGDLYRGKVDATVPLLENSGGNLLARWSRQQGDGSRNSLQLYYDHTYRSDPITFADRMDILDVEYLQAFAPMGRHAVQWGGGYRAARDQTQPRLLTAFIPQDRNLYWGNVFVQDEVTLSPELRLTAGLKLETNVYTGLEVLPNVRIAWTLKPDQLAWAAYSRAVRAPARLDREFYFPGRPPYFILGGPNVQSELANVIEAGYRVQAGEAFGLSVTAYYTKWDRLRSGQPAPAVVENKIDGDTTGLEAWASYRPFGAWRLSAGGFLLNQDLRVKPGSTDPVGPSALGNDPKRQWMLRSTHNLGRSVELDMRARYVGELPSPRVPSYTAFDASLGWRVTPALEISLVVNNAFDAGHIEFQDPASASVIERSVFAKVVWRM